MIGRAAVPFGARRATVVRPGRRPAPRTGPPRPRPSAWAPAWASAPAYASRRRGAWRRAGIHPGARASRTGPGRVGPSRGSAPGRSGPRARRSATRARSRPTRAGARTRAGAGPEPVWEAGRGGARPQDGEPGRSETGAEPGPGSRARTRLPGASRSPGAGCPGRAARGGGGCRRGTTSGLGRGRDRGGRRLNDRRVCGRHGGAVPSLLLWDKRMARAGRARGLGVCDAAGPSGPSDSPCRAARTGARGCGGWDRRGVDRPGCCRARGRRPSVRGGAAAPGGWPGP